MREYVLSTCEKNFILNAASELKRLDGRKPDEFRNMNVYFGKDWGLCYTCLGQTRVIAKVSCEVEEPKATRPNEGFLVINVEVSTMAALHVEPGRGSDISSHLQKFLQRCIKDSRAVDLESLCLVAEEKVWALRVDISILNHDGWYYIYGYLEYCDKKAFIILFLPHKELFCFGTGNLIQAASVAALAALAHFKRPDVTTNGEEIIIHKYSERDPIAITLHHYPIYISYALLNNGENIIADPTALEERISDTDISFGVNTYGEICELHLSGNALVEPNLIVKYSKKAALKAKEFVDIIKEALITDCAERQSKTSFGLVESISWNQSKSVSDRRLTIQLRNFSPRNESGKKIFGADDDARKAEIIDLGENCAELVHIHGSRLED